MPFEPLPWDRNTLLTDIRMMNQPGFGAIYLIDDERKAIVETGTSWEVDRILAAVDKFGLRPMDIDAIIVSHIHLDHAGGAGFLLDKMARATVYVHDVGRRHLADPARLLASAARALGEGASEFGTMRPVPEDRLVGVGNNDRLDLGGRVLRFLHSPGHAPHELTVFDTKTEALFTGDAAGLWFPRDDLLLPITPAPSFDLEANLDTFRNLLALEPRALLFSHYGPHERPREAIERQLNLYPEWDTFVRDRLPELGEDGATRALYDTHCRGARTYPREFLERRIRQSVNGLAVYHERLERATEKRAA